MRVLFLTRYFYPHIGGVEKHVYFLSNELSKKGIAITILTTKHDSALKATESLDKIKVRRVPFPNIKILGLIYIWIWFIKHRQIIAQHDLVHCHDVFIWYLPIRFLYPNKPVFVTFHGWEGNYPIPFINILIKRVSSILSRGNICVGKYLEKYYGIQSNAVVYGATHTKSERNFTIKKDKRKIVYVGRLERDTSLPFFLRKLNKFQGYTIDFCGDGELRNKCEKYGTVHGYTNPEPYLLKAAICFAQGYLSALEALSFKCKLWVGTGDKIRRDIWRLSPFWKFVNRDNPIPGYLWSQKQTWKKLTLTYFRLWKLE